MTDKELLEAAARAVGLEHEGYTEEFFDPECGTDTGLQYNCGIPWIWNPLTNDGDAFRLMVDLELAVISSKPQTWCESKRGIEAVNHCNDKMSATRRAIVLAAAGLVKK